MAILDKLTMNKMYYGTEELTPESVGNYTKPMSIPIDNSLVLNREKDIKKSVKNKNITTQSGNPANNPTTSTINKMKQDSEKIAQQEKALQEMGTMIRDFQKKDSRRAFQDKRSYFWRNHKDNFNSKEAKQDFVNKFGEMFKLNPDGSDLDQKYAKFINNAEDVQRYKRQLRNVSENHQFSPEQLQEFERLGFYDYEKYLRPSTLAKAGSLQGTLQRAAIADTGGGIFGSAGQHLKEREDAFIEKYNTLNLADTKNRLDSLKGQSLNTKQKFDASRALRKDLTADTKELKTIYEHQKNITAFYNKLLTPDSKGVETPKSFTFDDGTKISKEEEGSKGITHVAMLYSFIKLLDPKSVVRPSETDLIGDALSVLNRMRINIDKIDQDLVLTDSQISEIKFMADQIFSSSASPLKDNIDTVKSNIKSYGLDENNVIPKFLKTALSESEKLNKGKKDVGEGYQYKGFNMPHSGE